MESNGWHTTNGWHATAGQQLAVLDYETQCYTIESIHPLGSGSEVNLHGIGLGVSCGIRGGTVGNVGVPAELVRQFLGKTFTRAELEGRNVRFCNGYLVYTWFGQDFFLCPGNRS